MSAPDQATCPACDDAGIVCRGFEVYEPGCAFSHREVEEVPCPVCRGPDPDYLRELREEDRRTEKDFPNVD